MTTLPPSYHSYTFDIEQVTGSLTTLSPPTKPQRSFRKKWEAQETTAYLEGCDYMEEEEEEEAVAAGGGSLDEKSKRCDGEAEQKREFSGFYLLGEDGGSQTETDEEIDGRESKEENKEWRQEEEVEEAGEQEDGEEGRGSEEVAGSDKEKDEMREDEKEGDNRDKRREEDEETDDETGSTTGEPASSPPRPGRRVIRLYQYDEDGQRYCHLPDPVPNEPGPAPRLKQRSVSLSRLNAIMAAASAGPLGTRETGREEERPHFHMEI